MHKAYQPLKPSTNKYLQKKWDQEYYDEHRKKVREAKSTLDTKGIRTPIHVQVKLKKAQIQEERQGIIDRDNLLLASKLIDIHYSKGRVDHRNVYPVRSLNFEKRRAELLQVTQENEMIYKRVTAQESGYRRELWEGDWAKTEQRRDGITRYPRGVSDKQKVKESVQFSEAHVWTPSSSSRTEDDETTDEDLEHQ